MTATAVLVTAPRDVSADECSRGAQQSGSIGFTIIRAVPHARASQLASNINPMSLSIRLALEEFIDVHLLLALRSRIVRLLYQASRENGHLA